MKGYVLGKDNELIKVVDIGKNKFGDPLIPAKTILKEPPKEKKKGYALVWNGLVWTYKEDHRGEKYWGIADEYGTEAKVMEDLGPFPPGTTTVEPKEPTQEEKWAKFIEDNYKKLSKEELRNRLYQTLKFKYIDDDISKGESNTPLCYLDGKNMTVDEAKARWFNYYGDDDEKATEALDASLAGKNYIREVVEKWI